jgi:hypothetical protein
VRIKSFITIQLRGVCVCKGKFVPVLNYAMNRYRRVDVFLTSALDGGEWSASRLCALPRRKELPVSMEQEAGWAREPL